MKKKVTAQDIAKACGVSQATVSYVINNREGQKIGEETRQRILKAVEEMNYVPNASARNMKKKHSAAVGIVCARDYSRQAFLEAMEGISEYLAKINYTMTIFYETGEEQPQYLKSYFSELIDGIIFISNSDHDDFIKGAVENGIPYTVICMDGVFSDKSPRPRSFDPALGECLDYCREHALKRIRYFSVENDGRFVNDKFPVFSALARERFPECDLKHVICRVKQRDYAEILPFLKCYMETEEFDVAICQNYDIGLAVQNEILKRRYAVPQGTKTIFLNYVNFYEMTWPSITGITVPYREMGGYAAKLLIAVVEEREEEFAYREFPSRLVHRESTRI